MPSTTKSVLRMTFNTSLGKTVSITMPQPRADLTQAEIEAAMDLIIAKNIFLTSGGELVSKRSARIIGTTTEDMYEQP